MYLGTCLTIPPPIGYGCIVYVCMYVCTMACTCLHPLSQLGCSVGSLSKVDSTLTLGCHVTTVSIYCAVCKARVVGFVNDHFVKYSTGLKRCQGHEVGTSQ